MPQQNTYKWVELSESDKQLVAKMHHMAYKKGTEKQFRKAFDQGQPDIILGELNGKKFAQVAPNSIDRMKILINGII